MMRAILISALVMTALSQPPASSASTATEPHVFKIARKAKIELSVSNDMTVEKKKADLFTVVVAPKVGNQFEILLTIVKVKDKDEPLATADEIRSFVRLQGTSLLKTAVEDKLKMFELTGEHGVGYVFMMTDKRSELPPGEFRYLCQGIMLVGEFRIGATLLTDSPDESIVVPFFEILRTAKPVK